MTITENFLKTYTDKAYKHTTMVRHKGTVVALAMDDNRRIYYSVLNLDDSDDKSPLDVNYWLENPQELSFPGEIAQVGYGVTDQTLMPIVKKGSREEAVRGTLRAEEINPFLSSTARLTADAPFQALSDAQYIYIFRQSIDDKHEDVVFKLDKLPPEASGDSKRTDYVKDVDNNKVPLVKDTLLVDRFILAGTELKPKMEVRYKRSRSKTRPHNSKDSLGAKDMEGNPFFEPTQELDFVGNLQQGRFSALLVPTQIASVQRWQVFAHNSQTGLIDSFNVERAADGLFNTKGTQFYTSPDPQYQKSVFERQPGKCPFTEQDLIPIVSKEGYGESALQFDGLDDYVDFGSIDFARGSYTIEAWFKTSASGPMTIATARKADKTYGIIIELQTNGKLRYRHCSGGSDYEIASTSACKNDIWHHFAAVKNDSEQKLYLDGALVTTSTVADNLTEALGVVIGRLGNRSKRHFNGLIDEVRLWNRARSDDEIKTDLNHRLVGNEVGLESYWRFDEGSGDTVYDQTENANHGTIQGDTVWVNSDVPLGDHPGIRRTSFKFEGRTIESGLASLLYYQQEKSNAGYDQQQKPIKKNARVMLATATVSTDSEKYVGVLDFALSREGKLAQVPDNIDLGKALDKGTNEDLERLSQLEQEVLALQEEINQGQFVQTQKIQASDKEASDYFGYSVAISGEWAIVGAYKEDTGGQNAGAAYIFHYQNGQWEETQKLLASDKEADDFFGRSVAISGEWAIVGAYEEDTGGQNAGAAYIFHYQNGQWEETQKLLASDNEADDLFGSSVAISGEWAIVGAYEEDTGGQNAGAAYIFHYQNGQWEETQKLLASDKETNDNFGYSVAISGDRAIVGAFVEDTGGQNAGAAYIFHYQNGQWEETQKLLASDNKASDYFGYSVAISGDRAIVGAFAEGTGVAGGGAAYIFHYQNGQWEETQKLLASDKEGYDLFGSSVAISGEWAIVGADQEDTGGQNAGAAYIFHYQNGQWEETQKLLASDKEGYDLFGYSVAISGDRAIVGAYEEDTGGQNAGAAYIFTQDSKTQQKQELIAKQSEIRELAGILDNNVTLPMHLLHTDSFGLTVAGGLLGFAYTNDTPQLFDSALGKLALYFRGSAGQFLAAYYDTNTSKAKYTLAAETGSINLLARSAEPEMDSATIAITSGTNADNCTVTIENTTVGITETWSQVPRNVIEFATVLNGAASKQVFIGTLAAAVSGTITSLNLASKVKQALNSDDTLLIGSTKVTVSEAVARDATSIPIASASLQVTAKTSVYLLPYDYEALASTNKATYELQKGSLLFIVVPGTAEGKVQNGAATGGEITQSCAWVADSPGKAYAFDGQDDYIALGDNSKLAQLDATDDLTLEAWVTSSSVESTTRLIHHHSPNSKYGLALKPGTPIEFMSALELDGNGDYVQILDSDAIDFGTDQDFTIEAWIKAASTQTDTTYSDNSIIEKWSASGGYSYVIRYVPSSGMVYVSRYDASNNPNITSTTAVNDSNFHHIAFVKSGSQLHLYIDGSEEGSTTDTTTANTKNSSSLFLGCRGGNQNYFTGQIDEVHIWNRARTQTEIQADMNRRLNGNESGLVAYYHFENGLTKDHTDNGHDGTMHGNPQVVTSPVPTTSYSLIAGVGNQFIESEKVLPCGSWHHLAAVFNQSYGLQFNGGYLKCGTETALNISQDLTVEIFLKIDNFNQKQGLISKGQLKDGTDQDVPYALYIDTDRKLVFAFEDKNHGYHDYKSTNPLSSNGFQKIALIRKRGQKTLENKETKTITVNDEPVTMEAIASVNFEEWDDIQFYIGETEAGNYRFNGDAGNTEQELEIGRITFGGDESYFQGTMSEVRVWNKALDQKELYSEIKGQEKGLIAWWRLEENEGNIAYDAKSGNHGKIVGAVQWVKNPDPNGSKFGLYLNGKVVNTITASSLPWGDEQFTLGAYKNGNNIQESFLGTLEEIRIWKVARTHEQIQDNLFTRLKGEKQDLIANYSFDLDNETELKDHSLLGNHLLVGTGESKPNSILSTAPISNDIAQVRSALAGVRTQFHDTIDSRPAVQEYGDMQYDSKGNLTGVMKRCYTYIKDGQWHLFTGYKVGNLITEWIAQAQFNPQVIGYIEGTPPVPSENMTYGTKGTGTDTYEGDGSTIDFIEADEVMYHYSSSKENGFNSSFGISGSVGLDLDLRVLLAPLGFGTSQKMEATVTLGSSAKFESSGTWLEEQNMSTGLNVTRQMSASLGGNWESPNNMLNPNLGRRYLAGNSGFALVQSETADIFALRLAHNNALVSLQFQPNPDIPKDWNIISFPLNPRYTKQGTLDGKVGYKNNSVCTDPDYPQAQTYGEYSYFKPKEAYALKKRINQEMQELQNYYNNFDASPLSANNPVNKLMKSNYGLLVSAAGARPGAGQALAAATTFGGLGDALSKDQSLARKFAKRNIANTYVWSIDGGFYAETTDTTDVVQDSVTGSYSFNTEFGTELSVETNIFGADLKFGLDSSMGGSLNITKTKTKEATKTFSINVNVMPSGDMQYYIPESGEPKYDDQGNPKLVTGRVDAYRFMTFYLDSSKENFEDLFSKVVDPIWLEQSDHPNAIAMRQANQAEKKPGCWRLMHRVTFVSRVLPEFDDPTAAPLESAMKAENIESNYELIKKLEPFVKNKTQNYVTFTDAVRNTLKTYLPELQPHEAEIIKYAALYFGVEEEV
ncbi:MAG: hypothetical protein F6K58_02360 [Symploca sp. SIO2E9]|nr:hypothetical protein [Symploca sp. SIO2E9]